MRSLFRTVALGLSLAASAFAQPYFAQQTGTIQTTGPRTGASGDNFFNVEGSATAFPSYGVARWDVTTMRSNLNLAYGVNNWRITSVDLVLTQSTAAFSAAGDVKVYYTADDTTDIKTAGSPLTYPFENTPGTPDLPVTLASPLTTYTFTVGTTGDENLYNIYSDGNTGERLAVRDDLTTGAGAKLTLVLVDVTTAVAATYRGQVGNGTADPPELRVTAVPLVGNPPTADAGIDQTVTDSDVTGSETVSLNGSGSHANAPATSITSYVWKEGATTIATGVNPSVSFTVGVHHVTLTVTDNLSGTASDGVDITVLSGVIIVADAGDNATVTANACDGTASIQLDGSGSTYNAGTITSYVWTNDRDGSVVSNLPIELIPLTLIGTQTYRLTVTGSGGETATDVVTIDVRPPVIFTGHDFDSMFADSINIVPPGPFTSPADGFSVYQRGVGSIPFGLLDDTLATFPGDLTGIVNDKKLDAWFGSLDLQNDDNPDGTGSVTLNFTITGRSNIKVAIDMGAMGDFEATATAGNVADEYTWTAVVDGGSPIPLFTIRTDEAIANSYRLGSGTTVSVNDPLVVNGTTVLTNILRTFTANLGATGNSLVLTLTASTNGDDEAYAFDNVLLYECEGGGDPCPCDGNLNGDGGVDIADLALFLSSFGATAPNIPSPCADINGDGVVDIADLALFLSRFGATCP
jgi:hypothetical protein